MEMCYDGALVMPSNFVAIETEEMEYIDAGTAKNFCNNLKGLWNKSTIFRHALKAGGFSWGYILSLAKVSFWYVSTKVAGMLSLSISLVSRALAVIAGLGVIAAAAYVWNKRIWY